VTVRTGIVGHDLSQADEALAANPAVEFAAAKLHQPWAREGLISRGGLVDSLTDSDAPIIAIVAPAGYGKSTTLAEMVERSAVPTAWVSLDEGDNDPMRLLAYLAAAFDEVDPIDPAVRHSFGSPTISPTAALSRFISSIPAPSEPFLLVIDNLEVIRSQDAKDVIVELALALPAKARLALASRSALPLPMARLRTHGLIVEIGVDDLAMDHSEARALLLGAKVELSEEELTSLFVQTEGWPVGLYLAALAVKAGGSITQPGLGFGGDDRLMADYLRSELLSRLSARTALFLRRTALLEQLSAPLCDAVLATKGSRGVLDSLEHSNLLLIPLDRQREWYRYHHLFRELLQAELLRSEPDLIPLLHDRAATWLEANGHPEAATAHAFASGDGDRAARLVATIAQPTYTAGRVDTVRGWLGWFERHSVVERYPYLAVLGTIIETMVGHPARAERWADLAEAGSDEELMPDGSTRESWMALMRAVLCRSGVAAMRADARLACDQLARQSPLRGPAVLFEGVSSLLAGDLDAADAELAHAVDVCLPIGAATSAAPALTERAAVAIERGDWSAAEAFTARAFTIVNQAHLENYLATIGAYAVAARIAAHRGDVELAKQHVMRASRLRPLCTYAFPPSAHLLLQLGHAYLELFDTAGARTVLGQVREILQLRPDVGVVGEQADALQSMLDAIRKGVVGASSLTTAELRLLPFLATHLSYPDIGERMYVSRHTVKSHAMAVFRKLGVSSRREAIERANEIGLLGV
jgi:LuxR family maltose regulon positive regulatory protein